MCTVTITGDAARTIVTMNRDEAKDRPEAAPRRWGTGAAAYVAPVDLRSGGTWIGVNARGVCVCLLNRYDDAPRGVRSRGHIARGLLEAGSFTEAAVTLAGFATADYSPFTVLLLEQRRGLRFDWTGSAGCSEGLAIGRPLMATSSSWNPGPVGRWRRRYFDACLAAAASERQALNDFHAVAPDGMSRWAPFVDRNDVFTRSIVQVALEPRMSTLRYWGREALLAGGLSRPHLMERLDRPEPLPAEP